MQPHVGRMFRPIDLRVTRRSALVGFISLLVIVAFLVLPYPRVPLQFTQFSGMEPRSLAVTAGPQGTVTHRLTLRNQSIIPVQVNGVEAVPGQPLTPVAVRVMPDEGDAASGPFRPFTLPPQESVYLLVTSPTVCGAEQDSLRIQYSIFGISWASDLSLGGAIKVSKFGCPWTGR